MLDKNGSADNTFCPIDWVDVFDRIGDESIIAEFADAFQRNGQTLLLSLKSAVKAHSPEQIELYAHALKGSSSNIGAIPLAKASWQLEKSASEKDLNKVDAQLKAIEHEYHYLHSLLSHSDWIERAKRAAHVGV